MLGSSILSSLFIGSALGKAISTFLIYTLGINLYTAVGIPALSPELALAKSFDLLDFGLTIIFTITNFIFIHYFIKSKNKLINIASLLFNLILFLQIHFAAYNLLYVLVFLSAFHFLLILAVKTKIVLHDFSEFNSEKLVLIANGLLAGFYFLLLINNFTSTILPLTALTLTPLFYLLLGSKHFKSHAHLLLALSIVAPTNLLWLLLVGVLSGISISLLKSTKDFAFSYIYPVVFIFLVIYNPLYYLGHFDSVEEGFWLGWLSGLREGKTLYRDIAAYHPPLIIWKLQLVQNIIGYSLKNTRLVLHLLQIAGIVFYYFLAKSLLRKRLSVFVVMLVSISLTTIMVRNNVEIRLGVGMLSLLLLSGFPLLAGAVAALSIFTSAEMGIVAILSGFLYLILFSQKRIKSISLYLSGLLLVSLPILIALQLSGALVPALSQIGFYASAFSSGYLSLPIERSVNSAFIHWHITNQYLSAYPFFWELARGGIVAAIFVAFTKFKSREFDERNKLAITLGVFGLIVFRAALGRSDIYHLLFPLLVAIPLLFFTLEKLNNKYLVPIFSLLLVFVFARNIVNASFIEAKLFQLQTYGREIGEQEKVLTEDQQNLVQYIQENTNKEDEIFAYPWQPEIYLLAERANTSKFYTPYAFFTEEYQQEMIEELQLNKPALIIYNPEMKFADLVPDSLPLVNSFILENYKEEKSFGNYKIMVARDSI